MGKTSTNILIALGLITVAFAGYYMLGQQSSLVLQSDTSDQVRQNMLNNTRVFIERSQTLEKIKMDTSIFEDSNFRSLKKYTTPVQERPIGRANPFADTTNTVSTN